MWVKSIEVKAAWIKDNALWVMPVHSRVARHVSYDVSSSLVRNVEPVCSGLSKSVCMCSINKSMSMCSIISQPFINWRGVEGKII